MRERAFMNMKSRFRRGPRWKNEKVERHWFIAPHVLPKIKYIHTTGQKLCCMVALLACIPLLFFCPTKMYVLNYIFMCIVIPGVNPGIYSVTMIIYLYFITQGQGF